MVDAVVGDADDYALAAALVREAGLLADQMRRGGLGVQYKTSISDVVTAADHAAEALVVARLGTARPNDGVIGEEGANSPGARHWLIDPVDGTYNFASGLPTWCAAVGLLDADQPVLGAIYQPTTDEAWLGGIDHPATRNGIPLTPLGNPRLAEVSVASYLHPTTLPDDSVRLPLLRAIGGAATVRMLGSGSVELAAVAAGRLGAFVQYDCLPWDWHPGSTIVRAAGGVTRVLQRHGHRWHIAGPAGVVDELSDLLDGG